MPETFEECTRLIKGICSRCGGELSPIETVDNCGDSTFWSGCKKCQTFDFGVNPSIYQIASKMVREKFFVYYSHLDEPKKNSPEHVEWEHSQISGTCKIVIEIINLQREAK